MSDDLSTSDDQKQSPSSDPGTLVQDPQQPAPMPDGKKDKKIDEAVGSLYKEAGPERVIEQKEFTPPPEVKEYVTEVKKEEAIDLQIPIEDEFGAILMESASPQKPKIFLPLDEPGILQGMKQKVGNSVRWLVTWCLRLIKMFPQRVFYQKTKQVRQDG